ncbi:hypothetical protein V1508DRAFT_421575 [Lipomyces doorenjongii]|uniref:uncharacterized protein n=1 Tax=Lipomyces doorenjongii TaxID=383834 RepID=UPI0034CE2030
MELIHPYSSAPYPMVQGQKQKRKLSDDGGGNKKQLRFASVTHQPNSIYQGQVSHFQHLQFPSQQDDVTNDSSDNAIWESNINMPRLEASARIPHVEGSSGWFSSREQRNEFSRSIEGCHLPSSSRIIEDYEIQQSPKSRIQTAPSELQPEAHFPGTQNDDIDLSDDTTDRANTSQEIEAPQMQSDNESVQKRRKLVYSMGYRADCEKCRAKIRGHYSHIVYLEEK